MNNWPAAASGIEHGAADNKGTSGGKKVNLALPQLGAFLEDWDSLGVVGGRVFCLSPDKPRYNCL